MTQLRLLSDGPPGFRVRAQMIAGVPVMAARIRTETPSAQRTLPAWLPPALVIGLLLRLIDAVVAQASQYKDEWWAWLVAVAKFIASWLCGRLP